MDEETKRKLAGLIGLGNRGRLLVVGVEQVKEAAKRGRVKLAFIAPDASHNSRDKIVPLLEARHIRIVDVLSAAELGGAVGRETTTAVGILDGHLARGLRVLMESGSAGAQ